MKQVLSKRSIAFVLAFLMIAAIFPVQTAFAAEAIKRADILSASSEIKAYVEKNHAIPDTVKIGSYDVHMGQYLKLAWDTSIDIYEGNNRTLYLEEISIPQNPRDTVPAEMKLYVDAEIGKKLSGSTIYSYYYEMAQRGSTFVENNDGLVPNYCTYYKNRNKTQYFYLGYENLVYSWSRVLHYYNENGALPNYVTVYPWSEISGEASVPVPTSDPSKTLSPLPTPEPTPYMEKSEVLPYIEKDKLCTAAKRVNTAVKINRELPKYVLLGSMRISMPQLLCAMASLVFDPTQESFPIHRVESSERSAEKIDGAGLFFEEYKELAYKVYAFSIYNMMAPSYVETSIGSVSFESMVYMLTDILMQHSAYKDFPDSVAVKSWKSISDITLPTPAPTSEITPPPTPTPIPPVMPVPTADVEYDIEGDTFNRGDMGKTGAVSSASAYASKIGIDILKKGGNAIDAAVATMFAVGLCEPSGSSVGGGGLATIYLAEEDRYFVYDYMTIAPAAGPNSSSAAMMLSVPGMVHGAISMLEKYGTMTLAEVINPTIDLARRGFIIDEEFVYRASLLNRKYKYAVDTFTLNSSGTALKAGDTYKNPDLANTLELIRDGGIDAFYNSAFTQKLVSYIQSEGGIITLDDFRNYTSFELKPKTTTYRGYPVYAGSGTAYGGSRVITMLNSMAKHDMASYGHDSAYSVRAAAVGFGMSSRGSSIRVKEDVLGILGDGIPFDDKTTTMLTTYDKWGNAVAANVTLGQNYGGSLAVPGTGFCFNSHTSGGVALARSGSTMAPCIVANKEGKPMIIVGSPGDSAIISATAITISNIIDFGMNVCQAVNAPRFYGDYGTSSMTIETRYSTATLEQLLRWGYSIYTREGEYSKGVGCVSAIHIDETDGTIMSAGDNRREYRGFAY